MQTFPPTLRRWTSRNGCKNLLLKLFGVYGVGFFRVLVEFLGQGYKSGEFYYVIFISLFQWLASHFLGTDPSQLACVGSASTGISRAMLPALVVGRCSNSNVFNTGSYVFTVVSRNLQPVSASF